MMSSSWRSVSILSKLIKLSFTNSSDIAATLWCAWRVNSPSGRADSPSGRGGRIRHVTKTLRHVTCRLRRVNSPAPELPPFSPLPPPSAPPSDPLRHPPTLSHISCRGTSHVRGESIYPQGRPVP
eukprot:939446-Prorocentrum_minimum.AAC.1